MMEGKEKREKLRVEIRRKNIEQHCRRIRKEWQDYDDDYR
jgi:hypothetical protein